MFIERVGGMMSMRGMYGVRRPDAEEFADRIISRHDSDGDGALSAEELEEMDDKVLGSDSDEDGVVTQEELVAKLSEMIENRDRPSLVGGRWPGMGRPDADEIAENIISRHDEDGDGALSAEELGALSEKMLESDSDEDGLLSREELVARISEKMSEINPGKPQPPYESQSVSELASQLLSKLELSEDETESILDLLNDYGVDVTV